MNSSVVWSKTDPRLIDINFFGKTFYYTHLTIIRKLTITDCLSYGNFKSLEEFTEMSLPLTVSLWMQLRSAVLLARKGIEDNTTVPVSLHKFLSGFKKKKVQKNLGK
jgi:hypothetical protein